MIKIPLELYVKNIEQSTNYVYWFKNKNYDDAPAHYHIALKTQKNNYIILNLITSQKEKIKRKYELKNSELLNYVIELSEYNFKFLSKDTSVIDCNRPICVSLDQLKELIDENNEYKFIETSIPETLLTEIRNKIQKSPIVKKYIKDLL